MNNDIGSHKGSHFDDPGLQQSLADPLPILYQSDQLIAINKPSGLLVHRSTLDKHEFNNAVRMLREQCGHYLYPVHRLDKPTSGVLLFALTKEAATAVSDQFENGLVQKSYLAVARGYCDNAGTIDHPVTDRDRKARDRKTRDQQIRDQKTRDQKNGDQNSDDQIARGQTTRDQTKNDEKTGATKKHLSKIRPPAEALTHYTTIANIELPIEVDRYPTTRYSMVRLQPITGRRHQIRLHMKHINHPLVGDTSYGKARHNQFFASHYQSSRLLLHAHSLTLTNPETQQPLTITAPVIDQQFVRVITDPTWQWRNPDNEMSFLQHQESPDL